jgi:hypothetical protein
VSAPPSVTKFTGDDLSGDWGKDKDSILPNLNTLAVQLASGLGGGLRLTENLGAQLLQFQVTIPPDWTVISSFSNGWTQIAAGALETGRYLKDSLGAVRLEGAIRSGAMNSTAFTLPPGYRPSAQLIFPAYAWNGATQVLGSLMINADGTVVPFLGANTEFHLSGITFASSERAAYAPACWPKYFKSSLPNGKAAMVVPGLVQDITPGGNGGVVALPATSVASANDSGRIRIDNILGLLPNHTYKVNLYALPG